MSTYKVKATKTTTGMQVAAGARGFEITFDEPNSTNTGMNPVEILLASFGACQSPPLNWPANGTLISKHFGSTLRVTWAAKTSMVRVCTSLPKSAMNLT